MKNLFIYLLLFFPLVSWSQTNEVEYIKNNCCAKLGSLDYAIDGSREPTLVEYISKNLLSNEIGEQFINNRSNLKPAETLFCNDSLFIANGKVSDQDFQITISKKAESLSKLQAEYFEYDGLKYLEKIQGSEVIGFNTSESEAHRIYSIQIISGDTMITVPNSAFFDLLSPNFCKTFGPMKPIEVFTSSDGEHFYIYLFGDTGASYYSNSISPPVSFIAKLIFNKERYIGRIVVDYKILKLYHVSCKGFIGF